MAPLIEQLIQGFGGAFSTVNLLYCLAGVTLGTAIGVLPGLGSLAAVSMIFPVTFYLEPTTALIMLAGVYYGAEYGGSTASILLNLPGTPSNAITCLDGYPMARQGRAGVALFVTTIASFVGGSLGIVLMMGMAPMVASIALAFGPAEYFSAVLFGLVAAGSVSASPLKGLSMVTLGLLLGCVGADVNSGVVRYNLGLLELYDGIGLVVLAMGLFGVSEVLASMWSSGRDGLRETISLRSMLPSAAEWRAIRFPMLRGSGVGCIIGPLPGAGPTLAAFLSYAFEKRLSRSPERFGHGAIEGVASPESGNNAAAQTAFIPTLTMGIPGSATMAIMLGALMIHGIQPGPRLMTEHSDLFWEVVASFWIGNVLLLLLNIPLIGVWVSILKIPYKFLYPGILTLICIGVYSINYNVFEVWLVLAIGAFGYLLRVLEFDPAPLLIGFVLGPMLEQNLRRALTISNGDFAIFVDRPISAVLVAAAAVFLASIVYLRLFRRRPRVG